MITTNDNVKVTVGDRVYDYYDMLCGTITKLEQTFEDDVWFEFQADNGRVFSLNGDRICSLPKARDLFPMDVVRVNFHDCPFCGKGSDEFIFLDHHLLIDWRNGKLIQNVFPALSAGIRERLINGSHEECFDKAFPEEPPTLCKNCGVEIDIIDYDLATDTDIWTHLSATNCTKPEE